MTRKQVSTEELISWQQADAPSLFPALPTSLTSAVLRFLFNRAWQGNFLKHSYSHVIRLSQSFTSFFNTNRWSTKHILALTSVCRVFFWNHCPLESVHCGPSLYCFIGHSHSYAAVIVHTILSDLSSSVFHIFSLCLGIKFKYHLPQSVFFHHPLKTQYILWALWHFGWTFEGLTFKFFIYLLMIY